MTRRIRFGFSLLEVLVTLMLVGLILMLAVQLLGEVHLTTVEVQRALPDSVPQLAIQLLRRDIQRSRDTETLAGTGPLGLRLPDGTRIYYDESLGRLTRTVLAADGTLQGQRVVLRDVRIWNWHDTLAPGLIEIQIVYQRHRQPGERRLGGLGSLRDSRPEIEDLSLRFTQRARRERWVF